MLFKEAQESVRWLFTSSSSSVLVILFVYFSPLLIRYIIVIFENAKERGCYIVLLNDRKPPKTCLLYPMTSTPKRAQNVCFLQKKPKNQTTIQEISCYTLKYHYPLA